MKKIAVVLSGCGVYDGSEIHETCAALLALCRAGGEAVVCAPSGPQMHVVNHLNGEPVNGSTRDILEESARLARGKISPLSAIDANDVDGVVLPGGFGAAKNLCTFALDGADCRVHPEVEAFLRAAHAAGRPIGAMCIAPVLLAKLFGADAGPSVTIGTDPATAGLVEAMGAKHIVCAATDIVVDNEAKLVTTPAYMLDGDIGQVFDGIDALVKKLLTMCR